MPNAHMNLTQNSRVWFLGLVVARAGYANCSLDINSYLPLTNVTDRVTNHS